MKTGLGGRLILAALLAFALPCLPPTAASAQEASAATPPADDPAERGYLRLEGHGGPVKGIAVSDDGTRAITASFDTSLGLWSLPDGRHLGWLEGHESGANAAVFLGDDRAISVGDDYVMIVWDLASLSEMARFEGHQGKLIAAAASPDGTHVATASWDGSIGLWPLDGGEVRWLKGHKANVNDVAFADQGTVLYSASYDGTIRRWDLTADGTGGGDAVVVKHGFGVNHIVLNEADDWLAYGALDGTVRMRRLSDDTEIADLTADRRPILALAHDPGAGLLAVGDGEGYIMVIRTSDWTIRRDFRAAVTGPIWALAWEPGDAEAPGRLLAGGIADEAAAWPVANGGGEAALFAGGPRAFHTDPSEMTNGERQFVRKCSICHSLTPDGGRKAGPTLWGVFGREAGTLTGYRFSDALIESSIIWSDETITALFRDGPDVVTPGSKMPVQRITGDDDRRDLIAYLKGKTGADE